MILNRIWQGFFFIAFIAAIYQVVFLGDVEVFQRIIASTFDMAKVSTEIAIGLIGVMTLWLGIMKIGENGGAVALLSRWSAPFFEKIFPDLPKGHHAFGSILMNFSANMLGLDNAATPLGLKAMKEMQSVNKEKDTASNAMIMFLVLNTSGLTLIPVSVMAIRAVQGAGNPSDVFLPILLATFCSTIGALILVGINQKINLLQPVVIGVVLVLLGLISVLVWFMSSLALDQRALYSSFMGNALIFSIIIAFMLLAAKKGVNLYESFIEGAKEGFKISVGIIPYLVAMLVGIGVFRASGAFEFILMGIQKMVLAVGLDDAFVPALPTAIMKPLSGSGARGMMIDTINAYGVDSFSGRLASVMQGSTETTFYTVAVYYGAIGIKKTKNTIGFGLLADLIGIISAIFIAYLFFNH